MIFSCPSCGASHFKPDAEVETGTDVVCRRCRHEFRVNLDGVIEPAASADDAEATTADAAGSASGGSGIESSETMIMDTSSLSAPGITAAGLPDDGSTAVSHGFADDGETRADLPAIESIPPADGFGDTSTDVAPGLDALESGGPFPSSMDFSPTGGDTMALEAVGQPEPPPADFLGGETEAIETHGVGLTDLPDAGVPDLESVPGGPDPSAGPLASPEPFEASEASEPHQDPLAPEAAGVSPELLQARDEARGGTVADDELPADLGLPPASHEDFDDDLTGVSEALPSEGHTPSTGAKTKQRAQRAFATAQHSAQEMAAVFMKQPLGVRIATGLAILTLIVIATVIVTSFGPRGPYAQWVKFDVSLRTGPGVGDGYSRIDSLPKGAEVTAYEATTNFMLVRDAFGRVGYVTKESLGDVPPVPDPKEPFADCRQSPIETNLEPCQTRARSQLDRCEAGCDGKPCIDGCATQFTDCMAGCETRLVVVEEAPRVAEAEGEIEPQTESEPEQKEPAEIDSPIEEAGNGEVREETSEPSEKKKKRNRKKRRRRKRR